MATKKVVQILCDRCGREVKTQNLDESDYDPEEESEIIISRRGMSDISFDDLCAKCSKRVHDLIADIALEKKDDVKSDESAQAALKSVEEKDQPATEAASSVA